MTFGEIIDSVLKRLGRSDSESRAAALEFCRNRLQMFWRAKPWRDTIRIGTTNTWTVPTESAMTNDSDYTTETLDEVVLPSDVDRVIGLWDPNTDLEFSPEELSILARVNPGVFQEHDSPFYKFTEVGRTGLPCPYPRWNSIGIKIGITPKVTEEGQTETASLTIATDNKTYEAPIGVTTWITVRQYLQGTAGWLMLPGWPDPIPTGEYWSFDQGIIEERIVAISKPQTNGKIKLDVTYTSVSGGTGKKIEVFGPILPTVPWTESRLLIRLHGGAPSGGEVAYIAKMRPPENITEDMELPIRGLEGAMVAAVLADMLERQREYQKAQVKIQEAVSLAQSVWREETEQAASARRIVPQVGEPSFRNILGL